MPDLRVVKTVLGAADRHWLDPAREAGSERLHRAVQSVVSRKGPGRVPLRLPGAGARDHRRVARDLQHRAAPRRPRPGAAADVSAEASHANGVYLRSVYLTGKLTGPRSRHRRVAARPGSPASLW